MKNNELTDYQKRQRTNLQTARMDPNLKAKLQAYAEQNQMSTSEVIRMAMDRYLNNDLTPNRARFTKRVTFWSPPDKWVAFTRKAKANGVSQSLALESALEDML